MVQLPTIPPVDKLPLLTRKDIRDNWEASVEEFTQTIFGLLNEQYHLEVNFNQLYAHANALDPLWAKTSSGACAKLYFEGFIEHLKAFTEEGEYVEAVDAFNDLISTRIIVLECDNTFPVSGCSVKGSAFEINYNQQQLATNMSYACAEFAQAFDDGLRAKDEYALPIMAHKSIRDNFEGDKKEVLLEKLNEELLGADINLTADYAAIWKEVVDGKKTKEGKDIDLHHYAGTLGAYIHSYFEGVVHQINTQFNKDRLSVEFFNDAVKEIVLEVVQEPKAGFKGTYHEFEIEDEKLILRTSPRYWGTDTSSVCVGLEHAL